jgi:predicted porin
MQNLREFRNMKKALLFVSIAAACGAAAAQSSVTLFGVVDVNVGWIDNTGPGATWQLGTNGMSTSRLGFRGIEDLGGGLKASFWLEGEIDADTGTARASFGSGDPATAGFNFQRRSTVSLSNQYGEVRLGRDNVPTYWTWSVYDPFGATGVGSSQNLQTDTKLTSGTNGSYGTASRASNIVSYILPDGIVGKGLTGQLSVAAGENAPGNKYYGGRIGYADGPYSIAAAYGETDVTASGDITHSVWNIGGSWNFGFVKVSGFFARAEVSGGVFAGSDQDNWLIGAAVPFEQWNFKLAYSEAKGGGAISGNGGTQIAVGVDYNLSKRSALYANYSHIDNDGSSTFRVISASPSITAGGTSQGVQAGIRHSF